MIERSTQTARTLLFVIGLTLALPGFSQVGHPAKGSWAGFLDPDTSTRERIRLLLDDHNGELSAVINPGRRGVDAHVVSLNAPEWKLRIEAETEEGSLVLTGTLSNLGSWTNRKYIGTYTLDGEEGTFHITLN